MSAVTFTPFSPVTFNTVYSLMPPKFDSPAPVSALSSALLYTTVHWPSALGGPLIDMPQTELSISCPHPLTCSSPHLPLLCGNTQFSSTCSGQRPLCPLASHSNLTHQLVLPALPAKYTQNPCGCPHRHYLHPVLAAVSPGT